MNREKQRSNRRAGKAILPVLLLIAMLGVGTMSVDYSYADILIWHSVHMKPGGTYNVSDAGWNTTVFIEKAGNYTLKGSSRCVRILIESGGANVYLADGLNINCSGHSYTGSRTAAIWVKDNGGTVKLISKKKAKITLEGYMCPAIRKEGTDTKLVFETEDPKNPGTINANSGSYDGSHSPSAIGSMLYSAGNMVFNSGNVIAKIRGANDCGAAIGGASDKNASNITVNGGYIEAYGSEEGAGIGAGAGGVFDGFYVNGGEVYAENDVDSLHIFESAAIGGGTNSINSDDQTPATIGAKNFYFKGGKVTAVSNGAGAAIGGGTNSGCSNINIEGGEVNATCKSKTARYQCYGAGIGGGYGYQVHSEVNISGGKVTAKGGPQAPGIGSQDSEKDYGGHTKKKCDTGTYRISGGTIYVGCGSDAHGDIGTRDSKVTITGGNLHVGSHPRGCSMVNKDGEDVHRVEISIDGVEDDGHAISDLIIDPKGYSYGMKDVETMSGKLHAWLPGNVHYNDHGVTSATVAIDGTAARCRGNISFTSNDGTLTPGTMVELKAGSSLRLGSAWAFRGVTSLQDMNPPGGITPGYKVTEYTAPGIDDPGARVVVAHADGTLLKSAGGYTDGDGKWIYDKTRAVMFEADLARIKYQVKFDSNAPKDASTKGRLSGTMENQEFTYGYAQNLSENAYKLPGYRFAGWKDGNGRSYTDRQSVLNLTDKDGEVVTLYADWTPEVYTITYSDGLGEGGASSCTPHKQENVPFDHTVRLDAYSDEAFGWQGRSNPSCGLHGWIGTEFGSFYDDNAYVTNLCMLDGNGKPVGGTLTAEWVEKEKIMVSVTRDSVPQEDLAPYLFLIRKTGDGEGTVYRGKFKVVGTGTNVRYVYDPEDHPEERIPEGTYDLWFDPAADTDTNTPAGPSGYEASSVEISYGGQYSVSTVFDYYTVTIAKDPAAVTPEGIGVITSAWISPAGGTLQPSDTIICRDGARLDMQSKVSGGYHFDGYSVLGITPGNGDDSKEFDPAKAKQAITVRGAADIMAHAEANVYAVRFDPNAKTGISGEMEDQDMVYDQPQKLFANRFERMGAVFFGWNTKKDGSGAEYADGETVENLTADDDGEVILYAQWGLIEYPITYVDDTGHLPPGKTNPDIYTVDMEPFTLVNPVSDDYNFTGWMGTGLKEPAKTVTIKENSIGERHYTATWTLKYFRVNFVDNGGTGVEPQLVRIHGKATKPKDPTREGYDFKGWYADSGLTKAFSFSREITADTTLYAKWAKKATPVKVRPVLMAKGKPSGKRAIKASWTKVPGAAKYVIYGAPCEKKLKRLKTTKKTGYKIRKVKGKKMKAHAAYRFRVAALDSKGRVIARSKVFHVITAKTMGRYANIRSIKAKKKSITLQKGKTAKVRAKVRLPKGKKHLSKKHGPALQYTSSDPKVASVSKKGRVKAVAPGKAIIYIQDISGMYCRVKVTVR